MMQTYVIRLAKNSMDKEYGAARILKAARQLCHDKI